MDYVWLGRSLKLSRLGLGAMGFGDTSWRSWMLGLEDSRAIFRRAIEAGINFIDSCDYYSAGRSEEIVDTLVAEHGNRDPLVIATKVGNERRTRRRHAVWRSERKEGDARQNTLPNHAQRSHAPAMLVVTDRDATAIRPAFDQGGELSAAIELRRLFPGITDSDQAGTFARAIAGWKPLPMKSGRPASSLALVAKARAAKGRSGGPDMRPAWHS